MSRNDIFEKVALLLQEEYKNLSENDFKLYIKNNLKRVLDFNKINFYKADVETLASYSEDIFKKVINTIDYFDLKNYLEIFLEKTKDYINLKILPPKEYWEYICKIAYIICILKDVSDCEKYISKVSNLKKRLRQISKEGVSNIPDDLKTELHKYETEEIILFDSMYEYLEYDKIITEIINNLPKKTSFEDLIEYGSYATKKVFINLNSSYISDIAEKYLLDVEFLVIGKDIESFKKYIINVACIISFMDDSPKKRELIERILRFRDVYYIYLREVRNIEYLESLKIIL